MKKNLKKLLLGTFLVSSLSLIGCSTKDKKVVESNNPNIKQELKNEIKTPAKNESKQPIDINKLASDTIFHVNWYTEEEEYSAGTAFLIDSPEIGEKVLLTAFHFLWPENAETFESNDLAKYIKGGKLTFGSSDSDTNATLKNSLIIENASVVPDIDRDIAAFTLHNAENLTTLPLATEPSKAGDKVYLLANLWDVEAEDINENCVYEGIVIGEEDGILFYELDEKYGTTGASGAPIVNEYGEVVGLHISSNKSTRAANSVSSFRDMVSTAKVSEISYPEDISNLVDQYSNTTQSEGEIIYLNQGEPMVTEFFDFEISNITLTEELNGFYEEDYNYLVLEAKLTTKPDNNDDVEMYYDDFWVEWGSDLEDYCYPLESGYTDNQLLDEYLIDQTTGTTGDLVFLIPKDSTEVTFGYQDYYQDSTTKKVHETNLYYMYIDLTNLK